MKKIDKTDLLKKIFSRRIFMVDYLQQVITDKRTFIANMEQIGM